MKIFDVCYIKKIHIKTCKIILRIRSLKTETKRNYFSTEKLRVKSILFKICIIKSCKSFNSTDHNVSKSSIYMFSGFKVIVRLNIHKCLKKNASDTKMRLELKQQFIYGDNSTCLMVRGSK